MKLVLAEKPSVAQSIAKVLGAAKREDGYLEGNGYVVSWCVGHLVELAQPEVYDAKYSKWAYADLPIFRWTGSMRFLPVRKTVWDSEKAHGQRRCCESCVCNRCRVVRLGDLKKKRDLIMSKSNLQTTHAERETGKPLLSTVTMANLKYLKWNKQPSTCSLCK